MREEWELWDRQCSACERYGPLDDMQLCQECGEKMERDLLRLREWDYTATAFGLPPERWEEARQAVITEYGAAMELLEPSQPKTKKKGRGRPPGQLHRGG